MTRNGTTPNKYNNHKYNHTAKEEGKNSGKKTQTGNFCPFCVFIFMSWLDLYREKKWRPTVLVWCQTITENADDAVLFNVDQKNILFFWLFFYLEGLNLHTLTCCSCFLLTPPSPSPLSLFSLISSQNNTKSRDLVGYWSCFLSFHFAFSLYFSCLYFLSNLSVLFRTLFMCEPT